MSDYSKLITEARNPQTINIDKMSASDIARLINEEDKKAALAVEEALPMISQGIEILANSLKTGGRIFYCGAGTSGRIGILDAAECAITFGVAPNTVIGLIAGGQDAFFSPKEFVEDDLQSIVVEMKKHKFDTRDTLVAVSASGSTNCVKGAIQYAKECGAYTIGITCNRNADLNGMTDIPIIAEAGPEVIAGYTAMKSGTVQKMIVNMLSTGAMIKFGRTRSNEMCFMLPNNKKLLDRAIRMICDSTGCDRDKAAFELFKADNSITVAIDSI